MKTHKTLVFIPTYNEKENVQEICERILALDLELDILFMDDNSPDGTGELLNELVKQHPSIRVVHRAEKSGIGSAHQDGIRWAYNNKYEILITMDCDFTHPPEYIPEIMKGAENFDIVVGSRYILKDSLAGWNLLRKALTLIGHSLTKWLLKMDYDATGAFRLYRIDRIPVYAFELVSSKGYSFLFESLFILNLNGFKIKEIPIRLPPRTYGHSKMKKRDAWHSFKYLFAIYITTLFNREKFEVYEPFNTNVGYFKDNQGWDQYWESQKSSGGLVYDAIAAFYRKFIIKRALNYFLKKYFRQDDKVLHAGCGSGQVDTDVVGYVNITAIDISEKALSIYKKVNKDRCNILNGNILDIRLPEGCMDGIYNLRVMEHFTKSDIKKILSEFYRVLKPDGKVILFWPPEYGLSIVFFKVLGYCLRIITRKNIKFHPDEVSRIKSKKQIKTFLEKEHFFLIEYYFGIKDFFTYSVIVAKKI
jgi:dolichol-phosphate mannosyltransferase